MPRDNRIPFRKMNGAGNEIVIVDLRGSSRLVTAAEARAMAGRTESRFDQLMVLHDPITPGADAYLRIYNTDGSEAGACGNGTRCVGWTVSQETGRRHLAFETEAGVLDVDVQSVDHITVDMGRPRFGWRDIPLARPCEDTGAIELAGGWLGRPELGAASTVNVGNPHAVFWVDDLNAHDFERTGALLETHDLFPDRVNVSLVRVVTRDALELRTWERGVGLTKACGSAACAAVVCAARTGRTERTATVRVPSGDELRIAWADNDQILMTGPVAFEYDGLSDAVLTAAIEA